MSFGRALLHGYRDAHGVELPWLDGIVRAKRPTRLPVVLARDRDELRWSYKRSDFPARFTRGKYVARLAAGSNVVVLSPENAAAFPTSDAVNEALNGLVRVAKSSASNKPFERPAFPIGCGHT